MTNAELPVTYHKAAKDNKNGWKIAERRRRVFRPREIPLLTNFLHKKITRAFGINRSEVPIIGYTLLYDIPKSPWQRYNIETIYPQNLVEEDKNAFEVGMSSLNEYATNKATQIFFERTLKGPLSKKMTKLYGAFADTMTYRFVLKNTYQAMRKVELAAKRRGDNFDSALLQAYLSPHNNSALNTIISKSGIPDCKNVNDLAIRIGKRDNFLDRDSQLASLIGIEENDSRLVQNLKGIIASFCVGGAWYAPGVIEVNYTLPLISAIPVLASAVGEMIMHKNTLGALAVSAGVSAVTSLMTAFIWTHELMHEYSTTEEHHGFKRVRLEKLEK